jgi:hypothetical protein
MWSNTHRVVALTIVLFGIFSSPVKAQVSPLIFARETIRIESPTPAANKPQPTKQPHASLSFDVEVRPEDALRLEYIHTLNELTNSSGVMVAFTAPGIVSLPAWRVPTPVDALFVMDNGTVAEILPNVVLADMTQEIASRSPIKAFLFLKAGSVKTLGIQPKDIVYSSKFTPAPPVME